MVHGCLLPILLFCMWYKYHQSQHDIIAWITDLLDYFSETFAGLHTHTHGSLLIPHCFGFFSNSTVEVELCLHTTEPNLL